jgi:hypothetical protein
MMDVCGVVLNNEKITWIINKEKLTHRAARRLFAALFRHVAEFILCRKTNRTAEESFGKVKIVKQFEQYLHACFC